MFFFCVALFFLLLSPVKADLKKRSVIFDQGHGQKFVIEKEGDLQLSKLSGLLREQGYDIKINTGKIIDSTLNTADVLIISGAFHTLLPEEIDAVISFVDQGGKLCVMLHVPQPFTGLMSRLNIYASNGVIQEQENMINNEPKDFFITNMEKHPLTKGLKKIGVHGAWALMSESKTAHIIARTGWKAWIDLNRDGKINETDARQSFGVIIAGTHGKGEYVIFGDDAIFQNKFLDQENMFLGKNLADWMK
jgi:hypothetical protein